MGYSFQSISSGAMLSSTFVNQMEANIRDHQHGVSSVTNLYGGNWTSVVTNTPTAIAHKFDTTETFTASGSRLLSVCNSGTEKFGVLFDGTFANISRVQAYSTDIQSIPHNTSTDIFTVNTKTDDTLNEFNVSSGRFTAANTGFYEIIGTVQLTTPSSSGIATLNFNVNGAIASPASIIRVQSGFAVSIQHSRIVKLDASQYLNLSAYHDLGGNFNISSNASISIYRLL